MMDAALYGLGIANVNLYGEDGIAIYVSSYGDVVGTTLADVRGVTEDERPLTRVVGHAIYPGCSLEEAQRLIATASREHALGASYPRAVVTLPTNMGGERLRAARCLLCGGVETTTSGQRVCDSCTA